MSECVYTRAECHHQGTKCSECPLTDLICDEFTDCLDLSYQQGKADQKKEYNEFFNFDKVVEIEKSKSYQQGARAFAEWLPNHFDLRFNNNPDVWLDEFFNHTREKALVKWQKGEE